MGPGVLYMWGDHVGFVTVIRAILYYVLFLIFLYIIFMYLYHCMGVARE